jgi:NAD(P)-dependent dehydrogenase (short-subunit alcohol dehydrogenase family)
MRRQRNNNDLLKIAAMTAGTFLVARAAIERLTEYNLNNKTVLITGGSRGLGLVMARELAREGARIVICARDNDELERAHSDLISRGAQVLAITCDITDQHQVNTMIDDVETHFGEIDVLINNAGVIEVGPMEVMKLEDYQEAMQTHFWAPL